MPHPGIDRCDLAVSESRSLNVDHKHTVKTISIQRARMILGEVGTPLSDQQIQEAIDYMFAMAQIEFDYLQSLQRATVNQPAPAKTPAQELFEKSLGGD